MRPPQTNSKADLRKRVEFETLPADLSARFINLPTERVDDAIADAQRRVLGWLASAATRGASRRQATTEW